MAAASSFVTWGGLAFGSFSGTLYRDDKQGIHSVKTSLDVLKRSVNSELLSQHGGVLFAFYHSTRED